LRCRAQLLRGVRNKREGDYFDHHRRSITDEFWTRLPLQDCNPGRTKNLVIQNLPGTVTHGFFRGNSAWACVRPGLGKQGSSDFLGFKHISGRSRTGRFQRKRKTRRDRMRAKLTALEAELRRRMHEPIPAQGQCRPSGARLLCAPCGADQRRASPRSTTRSRIFGGARSRSAAKRIRPRGTASIGSRRNFYPCRASYIPGLMIAFSSTTQGGSRVPELGPLGFVRGRAVMGVPTAINFYVPTAMSSIGAGGGSRSR
jgi:hypothetical protein